MYVNTAERILTQSSESMSRWYCRSSSHWWTWASMSSSLDSGHLQPVPDQFSPIESVIEPLRELSARSSDSHRSETPLQSFGWVSREDAPLKRVALSVSKYWYKNIFILLFYFNWSTHFVSVLWLIWDVFVCVSNRCGRKLSFWERSWLNNMKMRCLIMSSSVHPW